MKRPAAQAPSGRAVAYLRVSTDAQTESQQRDTITAWAARTGHTVTSWHVDHGFSGGLELAKRPGLLDAVMSVGRGDVLVVAKRDRLARDVVIAATVSAMVEKAGARVVSADGVTTEDTPEGRLLRTILDAFSEYERAVIRARTACAMAARRRRGMATSHAPWGYRTGADGALVEDAREQDITALVHALRAEGLSLRTIVAELETEGLTGRTGRPLTLTQVARMAGTGEAP